jgi:hypothetical protein
LTSRDRAKLRERAKGLAAQGYQVETRTVDAGDLAGVATLISDVGS